MFLSILLVSALLLLFLLLLTPVDLEGRMVWDERPETRIRIGWLFGLVHKNIGGEGEEKERVPPEDNEKKNKKKRIDGREVLQIIRIEGMPGRLEEMATGLIGALRIRFFRVHIRVGLADPADTGRLLGLLWSMIAPLEAFFPMDAKIEPNFYEEVFGAEMAGVVRVWPIRAAPPVVRFLLSRPAWKAGWVVVDMMRDVSRKSTIRSDLP
ncbi:MAG: DUF2953 domain-containing protein [Euryarchaeota archaeon]|nr:DUF2953 domain-containing protein [Euryarchaeota archaeon]